MDAVDLLERRTDTPVSDAAPVTAAAAPTDRATVPPVAAALPGSSSPSRPRKRVVFAGMTAGQIGFCVLAIAVLLWGVWITHKVVVVDHRRIVSVRLSSLVGDFVNTEARSGDTPQDVSARTQAYMGALELLLKQRAASGDTVIVGEAVVGDSVPDVTSEIAAQLARVVKLPRALPLPAPVAPAAGAAPAASPAVQPSQSFTPQFTMPSGSMGGQQAMPAPSYPAAPSTDGALGAAQGGEN